MVTVGHEEDRVEESELGYECPQEFVRLAVIRLRLS